MTEGTRLRLLTWNVRNCRGVDQRVTPERVLDLLAAQDADVVALQELDVGRARSRRMDQPSWLAERLGMEVVFCDTLGGYGHAVLTRLRVHASEHITLPALSRETEPRGALDVVVSLGAHRTLRVLATHLGLSAADRTMQARLLLDRLSEDGPTVLLGDLNAGPGQLGYVELVPTLSDPLSPWPHRARCTWPSLFPFRALDHVLLSSELGAVRAAVLDGGAARFASDHRPVVVDALSATDR